MILIGIWIGVERYGLYDKFGHYVTGKTEFKSILALVAGALLLAIYYWLYLYANH